MKLPSFSGEADCAIVTGAGLDRRDHDVPSAAGVLSVSYAAGLLHGQQVDNLIFTGSGALGGEAHAESVAMKNYAVRRFDIDPDRIFTETDSSSTVQNIFFGISLARKLGLGENGVVVTRESQLGRASLIGGLATEATGFKIIQVVAPHESSLSLIHTPVTKARERFQVRLTKRLVDGCGEGMTPEEINDLYTEILKSSYGFRAKKAYHIARRTLGLEKF